MFFDILWIDFLRPCINRNTRNRTHKHTMKKSKGDEKRLEIIKHAERIFSKKGNDAKICEIASASGIPDSVLYYHFKNKEDLLFSVTGEGLNRAYHLLVEQLNGIRDPVSRLGKLIWFQMYYHETHTDYANLLLFECRSSGNFINHHAFNGIKKWSRIGSDILQDGIKKGIFEKDLNINVMRDVVFGLVDMQNIQSLATKEIHESYNDFDDILNIVIPMVEKHAAVTVKRHSKSNAIIRAAEEIFAEFGFKKTTIAAIANKANVSEGIIYEYFENKENLLFSLLDQQMEFNIHSLDDLFEIKNLVQKLRRFMLFYFINYLRRPSSLKTFIYNAIYNRKFYQSKVYKTFSLYFNHMYDILDEGKASGVFKKDVNNRICRNIFLGAFSHMTLRWHCTEKGSQADRLGEINCLIDMIIKAISV